MFSQRTDWNLAPTRFAEAVERYRLGGGQLLDLSESNPTRVGLRYDGLAILKGFLQPGVLCYAPDPRGLRTAREAVAGYYRWRAGEHEPARLELDSDRILLTTSTSEAYSFLFRLLCDPGDAILAPRPSYPLFEYLAGLHDVRLVHYPLLYDDGWQIDLHALEAALTPRVRAIVVVHPNNPTGSFARPAEMAALADLCRRLDIALIADEVFLDYAHDGFPRHSFAATNDALTFTLSGLSKVAALPQMKVAWIVASGPEFQRDEALRRLEVISDTYLSMNTPVQLAITALLEQGRSIQTQLQARIRQNLTTLDALLETQQLASRLNMDGGWYAVLRVPATGPDEDVAIALLEREGVLVHPGHFYDFERDGFLVMSLIVREDLFGEGLSRLLGYVAAK